MDTKTERGVDRDLTIQVQFRPGDSLCYSGVIDFQPSVKADPMMYVAMLAVATWLVRGHLQAVLKDLPPQERLEAARHYELLTQPGMDEVLGVQRDVSENEEVH